MNKQIAIAAVLSFVLAIDFCLPAEAAVLQEKEEQAKEKTTVTLSGELTNYFISESHAYFSESGRSWLETSARLGVMLNTKKFAIDISAMGLKTTGRDPYGTGSLPADAPASTRAPGTLPIFYLDKAYVQLTNIGGLPLKVTLGRQPITIDSQFLIGDGVYDGFDPGARQAVYHNPRKSFDALRAEWDLKKTHFDSFIYRVDPTWDGGGRRNGLFGGIDMSRTLEKGRGTYGLGLFYRHSPSKTDNEMAVLNARAKKQLTTKNDLYISGELVLELAGKCRNATYCTTVGQKMSEQAWHVEAGYEASAARLKPFTELGYVYYSKDFTPIATGFSDWGKWYLGNQIDWIVFGTNTKVIRGQVGFWPHTTAKLRLQYHNTRLASQTGAGSGGSLANEFSLIGEWYPKDKLWFNVLLGQSSPGRALTASGLGNPFAAFNSGVAMVGSRASIDVVLATGVRF
jgi:hypothetical protein